MRYNGKKYKIISGLIAISVALSTSYTVIPAPKADAFLIGYMIGRAIKGSILSNKEYRKALEYGVNPGLQHQMYLYANGEYGLNGSAYNNKVTDDVMHQLLNNGFYVVDEYTLPFRWNVNNSEIINASCYIGNYISINKGLLVALNYDKDEIAAVLSHEMTHGLRHHSAKEMKNKVFQKVSLSALKNGNGQLVDRLVENIDAFSSAKNISIPHENEADEEGFYIMSSAGFNPGGMAALQSKLLGYYPEKHRFMSDFFYPSDHPDTENRLKKIGKLLEEYSMNHVFVKNNNEVYIDNGLFFIACEEEKYTSDEIAWLVAGSIAKGFHDNKLFSTWFVDESNGERKFALEGEAYKPLINVLEKEKSIDNLFEYVKAAYDDDKITGNRDRISMKEQKRIDDWKSENDEAIKNDQNIVQRHLDNAILYGNNGLIEQALWESRNLLKCDSNNSKGLIENAFAEYYFANYEEAVSSCNKLINVNTANTTALLIRACSNFRLNNYPDVIKDIDKLEELHCDEIDFFTLKIKYNLAIGDRDVAEKIANEFKLIYPNDSETIVKHEELLK